MTAWHNIKSLRTIDAEDFKGLSESKALIEALLDQEVKAGTPSDRIVLGGFSQGAAMSALVGLQYSKPLAGIVCMSGYLPFNGDFGKAINAAQKKTPVLVCHGDADQVVAPEAGDKLYKTLKAAGVKVTYKVYEDMPHSACPEDIADIQTFLKDCLKDAPAAAPAAAATGSSKADASSSSAKS